MLVYSRSSLLASILNRQFSIAHNHVSSSSLRLLRARSLFRTRLFLPAQNSPAVRRAIVVLPFISMVTEKVKHLQRVVAPYNRGRPKQQRIKVRHARHERILRQSKFFGSGVLSGLCAPVGTCLPRECRVLKRNLFRHALTVDQQPA